MSYVLGICNRLSGFSFVIINPGPMIYANKFRAFSEHENSENEKKRRRKTVLNLNQSWRCLQSVLALAVVLQKFV